MSGQVSYVRATIINGGPVLMRIFPLPWVQDALKWFPSAHLVRRWAFGKAYFLEMARRQYIILDESILSELYDCNDEFGREEKPPLISLLEFDGEKERDEYISASLNFAADGPDAWRIYTPASQEKNQGTRLGSLVSLKSVKRAMIRDDWDGLSWKAPIERSYFLYPGDKSFYGNCLFGAGEPECCQRYNIDSVNIPIDTMGGFFARIEGIRIQGGSYWPRVIKGHEVITMGIYIDTGEDRVVLSTESQGRFHKPWGVRIGGKGYVYNGRQICRALRDLWPFLKQKTFGRLCQGVKALSRPFWET